MNHNYVPGFDRSVIKSTDKDPRTLGKRKMQSVSIEPDRVELHGSGGPTNATFLDHLKQFDVEKLYTKATPKSKGTQTDPDGRIGNQNLDDFLYKLANYPIKSDKDFNVAASFTFTMLESLMDYQAKRLPVEKFTTILTPFEDFATNFHGAMDRMRDTRPSPCTSISEPRTQCEPQFSVNHPGSSSQSHYNDIYEPY